MNASMLVLSSVSLLLYSQGSQDQGMVLPDVGASTTLSIIKTISKSHLKGSPPR